VPIRIFEGVIDRGAVALFMRHNYIPAPYSIYSGISKVIPGSIITITPDPAAVPQVRPYWSVAAAVEQGSADPFCGTANDAIDDLEKLLRDAVKLRMEADVPLGAFLSGGVDSSTIVALMQAQSTRPVQTFSIGFHEAAYNEAHHAKAVADYLGTAHTELYVSPAEAMEVIPRLPTLYDEPFADSSQIPTYLVSELTRRYVKVALSGDAGDELFAGYNQYRWGLRFWNHAAGIPWSVRKLVAKAVTGISAAIMGGLSPHDCSASSVPLATAGYGAQIPYPCRHVCRGMS
jgi:asparagine synthase (glutamine-hydrolysing)